MAGQAPFNFSPRISHDAHMKKLTHKWKFSAAFQHFADQHDVIQAEFSPVWPFVSMPLVFLAQDQFVTSDPRALERWT